MKKKWHITTADARAERRGTRIAAPSFWLVMGALVKDVNVAENIRKNAGAVKFRVVLGECRPPRGSSTHTHTVKSLSHSSDSSFDLVTL